VNLDRRVAPALDTLRKASAARWRSSPAGPSASSTTVLAPYRFDTAGLHGAQIRTGGEIRSQSDVPDAMREATRDLVRFANSNVGVIVEDKRISIALHWRLAPQLKDEAMELMRAIASTNGAGHPAAGRQVSRRAGAGRRQQGRRHRMLMHALAPYAGRRPSSSATTSPTRPASRP
jgi:trehalose 6-phosphate phosphatase